MNAEQATQAVMEILHGDDLRNSQDSQRFARVANGSRPSAARLFAKFAGFAGGEHSQRWTVANQDLIRSWLAAIGETNPDITREVLDRCRTDPAARRFFVDLATTHNPPITD